MLSEKEVKAMIDDWGNRAPKYCTITYLCLAVARASARAERARCAKICDDIAGKYMHSVPMIDAALTAAQVDVAIECNWAIRQQSDPPPSKTGMQRETTE